MVELNIFLKKNYFLPKFVVLPLKALILIVIFAEGFSADEKFNSSEAILTGGFGKRIKVIFYIFNKYFYFYINIIMILYQYNFFKISYLC
jgi:hypothetical protein